MFHIDISYIHLLFYTFLFSFTFIFPRMRVNKIKIEHYYTYKSMKQLVSKNRINIIIVSIYTSWQY